MENQGSKSVILEQNAVHCRSDHRPLFKSLRINGSQNGVVKSRNTSDLGVVMFGLLPINAPNFFESMGAFSDHLVGLEGCSFQNEVGKKVIFEHFLDRNAPHQSRIIEVWAVAHQ